MSESTFGADLDALVRGERIVSNDDLTHFASDLYGEEQNVTMPNALKLRIANDLGLASAKEPTRLAAPVSRRTLRASEQQRRSSRPWAIALTIAAAVLLALTGILRWGLFTSDDQPDNRFLFSSPAVPTVAATPEATPESDLSWQQPVSPEECVIRDIGELPNAEPEAFDAETDRSYTVVGPADSTDAYAANDVVRQYMACDNPPALLSDQAAVEASLSDGGSFPVTVAMLDRQLMDGMHLSAQLEEQGLTPEDTVVNADVGPTGFFAPNPEIAFVLEDGRVLIMTVAVSGSADGTQWSVGTTLLLVQEDGAWKVDEQVPVCIGPCDDTFAEIESLYTNALWLSPVTAEECERNAYLPAGLSDEQAAAIRGRQYIACEMNGDVQQLQGPDYRVTEGEAARPLSDEIALLHRQNGEAPGSLQRIAPEYMMPMTEFPSEPWRTYQPQSVVMLADGRIAALEASVISPEIISASNRSSPVITTALVWVVDGDSWSLDEEVTVCLGICDAFWGDEIAATPVALEETPESVVIPETCEGSDEFVADFTSHDRLPIQLRPNPIMEAGVYVEVLDPRAPLQYLCESEETTNPTLDRMDEGQRWLKIRTEGGTEGWIREVDVREYQP